MWEDRKATQKRNPNRNIPGYPEVEELSPYDTPFNQERVVRRWIQKAKKIIANVERGEFPGDI